MAALTLEAWRDRTLEQVHFAAQAALHAVVVQGNPRLRACVAATATGDLHQCLAQGPNLAAVRRMAQETAGRAAAAPGFATTPDPKGMLSLENLTEALHRLGVENTLWLHGFPASSHQYRNLIPALADTFHGFCQVVDHAF
jgi:hypothetical protein